MTTLIMPIIFPRPYFDESPIGYLIRVAQKNAYKRVRWLYSQDRRMFTLAPLRLLEHLLEAEWSGFNRISNIVHEVCQLDISHLNFTSMRYCPKCLNDKKYHRVKWYLAGSAICLDHGCWLVDDCPECHSKIDFKEASSITECYCGASLLASETKEAPKSAIRYARFFDGLAAIEDNDFAFSKVFDGSQYTLENRVKLSRVLVRWSLSSSEFYHRPGSFTGLNSISTAKAAIDAFSHSWLSSLDSFVNYITTVHQKIYQDQAEGDELFRYFYKTVFRELVHPGFKPIKDTIQVYMNDHWIHALDKRNSLFMKEAIGAHKWLALQAASRELGVPKSFITQGMESGEIRYDLKKKESREHVLVHREDVIKFNRARASYVNALTAASLLGVTKSQMNELRDNGLITRDKRPGLPLSGYYALDDIERLMDALNSKLMVSEQDFIPLSEAVRKIGNGIKGPFVSLVKAIISGEINAELDPNHIGFRRLRIDSVELKKWYVEKIKYDNSTFFTMQKLRCHFQVSSDLIPQLVHSGLISSLPKATLKSRPRISIQAVNQFKERYVLLSKLSLCCSVPSIALIKKFNSCEIFPVDHDWEEDNRFVQKVYYRHELLFISDIQVFISSMADWEYESF